MTRSLAVEAHSFAGELERIMRDVELSGFVVGPVQRNADVTITFLAKRP